jgi:hypothetical protein
MRRANVLLGVVVLALNRYISLGARGHRNKHQLQRACSQALACMDPPPSTCAPRPSEAGIAVRAGQ